MTAQRGTLPTLTEVIEIDTELLPAAVVPAPLPPESLPMEMDLAPPIGSRAVLTAQVLEVLLPRVDSLLEARLNDVLAVQLSRLTEDVTQGLRAELASAMHSLVAQVIDEMLARQRRP
jgi:hypothetical protein